MKKSNKKYLKIGSYSVTVTAVVIAIYIIANLLVSEIPTVYTKFEVSEMKLYDISDETVKVIDSIDEDVTVYLLASHGGEDMTLTELLDRYAALSSHIKVKTVDPATDPTFIPKYTSDQLYSNSLIVESPARHSIVSYYDIYVTEYSEEELYYYYNYGQQPTGTSYFNGELALTTALDYVTRDDLPTMYSLTGHGETELTEYYTTLIKTENIAMESLSLVSENGIPAECSSILINNPSADISEKELEALKAYSNEGGNIILITNPTKYSSEKMPNITSLAKHLGLEPIDGIVYEEDRDYYYMQKQYIIPELGDTSSEPLSLLTYKVNAFLDSAHGIKSLETHTVTSLLSTTSSSYVADSPVKDEAAVSGPIDVAVSVSGTADGTRGETYKFVWFASSSIVDENANQMVSGGNSSIFISSLNWMSDSKTNLSILAKELNLEALTVTESEANLWSAVLIFVLPIAVLVTGFIIWIKRRRK